MSAINILLLLFVLPTAATAADECFCLQNKDDHLRHSCEMQQQGPRQVAQCRDDAGKPYKIDGSNITDDPKKIDDPNLWLRVAEGKGRCNPCKQTINVMRGDIRGDSGKDTIK